MALSGVNEVLDILADAILLMHVSCSLFIERAVKRSLPSTR